MPSIQVKDANSATQTVQTLPAVGQAASANSLPVVIASDQSAVAVSGTVAVSGSVTTAPPANASANISQVGGTALALGQKASASSVPVVLASDQSTVAVSAASLPLPSGAASAANQTSVQSSPGTSAGTALTIQGAASGVAVPVSLAGAVQANAYGATTNRISYSGNITAAANPVAAIAAQGSGEYAYVTDIDVTNAGSYSFLVQLLNSASTVLWQALVPAGGGVCKAFETPVGGNGQMTANTALSLQAQYLGAQVTGVVISSGTYNSSTGAVSLTLSAAAAFTSPESITLSGLTGTGAFASLDGTFTTTSVSGTTVNFTGPTGLGTVTITGGSLAYFPAPNLYANLNGFKSAN